MWRKSLYVSNRRRKSFVYVCALVAMLFYAIPRLPRLQHGVAGTFAFLWIGFAGLVLAANLYFLVGADKERSRLLSAKQGGVVMPSDEQEEAPESLQQQSL